MTEDRNPVATVIGPTGDVLTEADLPPQGTTRWVPRRKAEIVAAVHGGLLSLTEACQRYRISHEEFRDWVGAYERNGLSGLRARRRRQRPEMMLVAGAQMTNEDSGNIPHPKASVSTSIPDASA